MPTPIDASEVTYSPADDTDWKDDVDPGDLDDALDQLAAERVTGPASAVDTRIAIYDATTGKLIKDNGFVAINVSNGRLTGGGLSDAMVSENNVTQHEAAIDHDALTNFASNKHRTVLSVRKSSDETINSDTTLSDDADLILSLAANTNYIVTGQINYNSGSVPDFKYAFTLPAFASLTIAAYVIRGTGATIRDGQYITDATAVTVGGNGNEMLTFHGTVKMGASAGSFTFKWAQNTSDAGDTTVYEGSFMRAEIV